MFCRNPVCSLFEERNGMQQLKPCRNYQIISAAARRRRLSRAAALTRTAMNANKPTASIAAFIWIIASEISNDILR